MSTTPGSTLAATDGTLRAEPALPLLLPLLWGAGTLLEETPVEPPLPLLFSATAVQAPAAAASTATTIRTARPRRLRGGGSR